MRVALYYPWLYVRSGAERTILELVRRSRHRWTIFTNRYEADATYPELRELDIVELPYVPVRRSVLQVGKAAWSIVGQRLSLEGFDRYVVVCEGLGDLTLFRNRKVPAFCICLTPLRAAFDPQYQERYLAMKGGGHPRRWLLAGLAFGFRLVDRVAWKRYERVFAISQEVRSRILRGRLCPDDRIEVLHPGIDTSALRALDEYDDYFLLPGRIMWTKNVELGIDAFMDLQRRRPDLHRFELVVAGFVDVKSRPYLARLRERAAGARIRFVESPDDDALFALYRRARAVLFTPFNEDWGIVPLEAMALGRPVVATDRGGARETVRHGETGFRVSPDPGAFSRAMEALADDAAAVRRMGRRGRESAARFDWSVFSGRIDDYLDGVERRVPVAAGSGDADGKGAASGA